LNSKNIGEEDELLLAARFELTIFSPRGLANDGLHDLVESLQGDEGDDPNFRNVLLS